MSRAYNAALISVFLGCLIADSVSAQQGPAKEEKIQLTYSDWIKFCLPGLSTCIVTRDAKTASGQVVLSVMLFEAERDHKKVLRITLPLGLQAVHGTRVIVDQNPPIQAGYVRCPSNGCKSDYAATPQLIEQISGGKNLVAQAINSNGAPLTLPMPLAGFSQVHDAPPDPRTIDLFASGDGDLLPNGNKVIPKRQGPFSFTPWTKFCLTGKEANAKQVCFTGTDMRGQDGTPMAALVLIEPEGDEKKVVRITVPNGVSLKAGSRIKIDDSPSLAAPYVICFANGCMADYAATTELISQFKSAKNLTIESAYGGGQRMNDQFALADFAKAFDGAPTDAKVFEASQKKLQEELDRRKAKSASTGNPRQADGSASGVIEAVWNNALVNISLGHVAVVTGVAGGNQEFACGSGSIGPSTLNFLKAAQTAGVVSLVEDSASQQYNRGQAFSWGQMLDQTTAGVNAQITITATSLGQSLDETSRLPAALRIQNCLRFHQGKFKITQILKEQNQRIGASDYRVIFVKYKAEWSPHYREIVRLTGTVLTEDRKATVLLKDDPFHGGLVWITEDASDSDKEFTTNNVNLFLARGR